MRFLRFKKRNKKRKKDLIVSELQSYYNNRKENDENQSQKQQHEGLNKNTNVAATIDQVPDLVQELKAAQQSKGEAARVLRKLFALSEHGKNLEETRQKMIADGSLVPALLEFLEQRHHGRRDDTRTTSAEPLQQPQLYLALLVLNNVSIPIANKRTVAIVHKGASVLSNLLCEDPSCHLVSIILVNLTFCDAALRRELVEHDNGIIMDALTYAFRVGSLTGDEYKARKHLLKQDSTGKIAPKERLGDPCGV